MNHNMNVTLSRDGNNLNLSVECSSKLAANKMNKVLQKIVNGWVALSNKSTN